LDRHVADGRAEQPALIYDSPVTGSQRTYTYGELLDETARFAGVLRGLCVGKGDRVVVYTRQRRAYFRAGKAFSRQAGSAGRRPSRTPNGLSG
jgi:acyl-coenzyme A synthetase/AMP-(fatty) acid ligase